MIAPEQVLDEQWSTFFAIERDAEKIGLHLTLATNPYGPGEVRAYRVAGDDIAGFEEVGVWTSVDDASAWLYSVLDAPDMEARIDAAADERAAYHRSRRNHPAGKLAA